jgi:hypothetical protein
MSAARFVETAAFAALALGTSLVLGAWIVTRRAEPLQSWLATGRPASGAEARGARRWPSHRRERGRSSGSR